MIRGAGIARLYQTGGANLLAYRLVRVFSELKTEKDVTLHNDVVVEVLDILNKGYPDAGTLTEEENRFFKYMAGIILYPKEKKVIRRKRFLFRVGEYVLRMGQKKGQI